MKLILPSVKNQGEQERDNSKRLDKKMKDGGVQL